MGVHRAAAGTELVVVQLPLHLPPPAALPGTGRVRRAARRAAVRSQRGLLQLPRLDEAMRAAAVGDAGQAQDGLLHGAQVGRAGVVAVVADTTGSDSDTQ